MVRYLAQGYLDATRGAHPQKTAVTEGRSAMTYERLYADSNRLGNGLKRRGIRRQERVAIFLERTVWAVLAIQGVLKADAIYVPVDVKSPAGRWRKILDDCRPAAIICGESQRKDVEVLRKEADFVRLVVVLDSPGNMVGSAESSSLNWEDIARESEGEPEYENIDTDIAYILYTSGSNGVPKGAAISHRNIINYIEWAVECFGIRPEDKICCTAPFHFDMSTFDIFCAMKSGASLCIAPDRLLLFPGKLLDMMEKEGVTLWKGVSSLLMYIATAGALRKDRIPSLRSILFGGEVLPTKHLIRWMETFPGKRFYNVYGPTEATGISAWYPVESIPAHPGETVPIGRPRANTELLLLGEDDRLVETGEIGEICVRGSGLGAGYWNNVAETEKAFVRNPRGTFPSDRIYRTGDLGRMRPDGNLEFVGRKDFQVKYLGYRIELYEIEKALASLGSINHAVVLLCDSGPHVIPELVGFVESAEKIDEESVLDILRKILPHYMVPKRLIRIRKIPQNQRGKTDRDALRASYRSLLEEVQKIQKDTSEPFPQ